jgi:Tn3 transposase DDE domain
MLAWLEDPALRRRVTAGLNKGEARNSLARAVFFRCYKIAKALIDADYSSKVGLWQGFSGPSHGPWRITGIPPQA